ncbi:hypothetical protein O9X98_08480 [Agrobacterium salinitolerans]|nr:hypothetical protein [Agrobacterium salinitolerans]
MASITLRKALRFKKQIEASLRTSTVSPLISIDIDDPRALASLLAAEEKAIIDGVERQLRLSSVLADLRAKIEANNARGVNAIMSQIGHVDRQIAAYKVIAESKALQPEMLAAKVERKRAASRNPQPQTHGYAHRGDDGSTIQVSPLSQGTISAFKAKLVALRKEKETLEDRRLALNNRDDLSIEIGDDDLGFLAELEIV